MSVFAVCGARILSGGRWHDDHALLVDRGHVAAVVPQVALDPGLAIERLDGGTLVPGFFDTQVNGGGGVLFNDAPTVAGIAAIAAAHRRFGTTALLPTLISDDPAVIARAMAGVDGMIAAGVPGIVGIHVEGPFLNPAKVGIHDPAHIRPLDASAIDLLASLRQGRTLVTLAPECAPAGAIAELVRRGVVVAAGHSEARYGEMARAASEGLTGVTHLFNAMRQLGSREPGLVGAALDLPLFAGVIADGHHVHAASLRTAWRAKGADRLMLVSDAMPSVGTDLAGFTLGGRWIDRADGALRGAEGTLAGSDLDMAAALRSAIAMMGVDLAEASAMASGTPAAFMGMADHFGALWPGQRADMVHLDDALTVQATWIAGERL
jgi:N-acetylglucosamine-6-phosphate deacetylase